MPIPQRPGGGTFPPRADGLFVAVFVILANLAFAGRIGYYGDDWRFFETLQSAPHHSFAAYYQALDGPPLWKRPLHTALMAFCYLVYGMQPLGNELLGLALFAGACVALLAVLGLLGIPRLERLGATLLYAVLPNNIPARIWFAALQAELSLLCFLLSTYAALRAPRARGPAFALWLIAAVVFQGAAGLAYEVVIPLSPIVAAIVVVKGRRSASAVTIAGCLMIATVAMTVFKAASMQPVGPSGIVTHLVHYAKLAVKAAVLHFGADGVAFPYLFAVAAHDLGSFGNLARIAILALALVAGLAILGYLRRFPDEENPAEAYWPRSMTLVGLGALFAAYTVDFTHPLDVSVAGLVGRVTNASSVGAVASIVGGLRWLWDARAWPNWRRIFIWGVTLYCAAGLVVDGDVLAHYARASARQEAILRALRQAVREPPHGTIVLLGGFCPDDGPGPIFETWWDSSNALALTYGDRTLRADVLNRDAKLGADGLTTHFDVGSQYYRYSRGTLLFDVSQARALPFEGPEARPAAARLLDFAARHCSRFSEDYGAPLFPPFR